MAFIESSVKHSLSSATSSSSTASGEVVCVPQTEERQSIENQVECLGTGSCSTTICDIHLDTCESDLVSTLTAGEHSPDRTDNLPSQDHMSIYGTVVVVVNRLLLQLLFRLPAMQPRNSPSSASEESSMDDGTRETSRDISFTIMSCGYSSQMDNTLSDVDCPNSQSAHVQRKFLVFESSVDELFRHCPECGKPVITTSKHEQGTCVIITAVCLEGHSP